MAGEEVAAKAGIAVIKEVLPLITELFGTFKGMGGNSATQPAVPISTQSDIAQAIEKVAFSIQRLATVIEEKK